MKKTKLTEENIHILPEEICEFLKGMFFIWEFPPTWVEITVNMEDDPKDYNGVEVSFVFDDKETEIHFIYDDCWCIETGEDSTEKLSSFHAEFYAFWQFIFNLRNHNEKS